MTEPTKRPRTRVPQAVTVRDNVPAGHVVRLSPALARELVSLFGEQALARVSAGRRGPAGGDAGGA